MTDIPQGLVVKAAEALASVPPGESSDTNLARAVLAAVWPDVADARQVVGRELTCKHCGHRIARAATSTGWTHEPGDPDHGWQGLRCPTRLTGAEPEDGEQRTPLARPHGLGLYRAVVPPDSAARPVDALDALERFVALRKADHAHDDYSQGIERAVADIRATGVAVAADVRRQTAEDIAAALEQKFGETSAPDNAASRAWANAIHNAARLAREVGERP